MEREKSYDLGSEYLVFITNQYLEVFQRQIPGYIYACTYYGRNHADLAGHPQKSRNERVIPET